MSERRWLASRAVLPGIAFVMLAALFATTDVDPAIARVWAFDAALGTFPAGHAWWANELLHTSGKYMVSTFGLASAGTWIASFFGTGWRAYRRPALFAFVALALGIAAGATFSFGQEARGAHFPSHDLWSAFVVWFTQLGLYAGAFRALVAAAGDLTPTYGKGPPQRALSGSTAQEAVARHCRLY